MSDIKTRESVKDIKVLDKAANAARSIRKATVRTRDGIENLADDGQISPSEYAEDMRQLSESDAVIMVVPLKQEQFSKVFETEQLCRGYGSEIIGVITM